VHPFLVRRAGELRAVAGSTRRSRSTACAGSASTRGRVTSSGRCGAVPTGRARSSRSADSARMRSRAPIARGASSRFEIQAARVVA
jgi:hypothetical protein